MTLLWLIYCHWSHRLPGILFTDREFPQLNHNVLPYLKKKTRKLINELVKSSRGQQSDVG